MASVGNRKFDVTTVLAIKAMVPVVDSRHTVRRSRTGTTADQITIIYFNFRPLIIVYLWNFLLRIRYNFKTRISSNFTTRELLYLYVLYKLKKTEKHCFKDVTNENEHFSELT